MEVTINSISKEIPEGYILLKALEDVISLNSKGIAVAVNNTVVQKAKWTEHILQSGDKITIIKATQGG